MAEGEKTNQLGETDWEWLELELKKLYESYVRVFGDGVDEETNKENFNYLIFNLVK